MPVYTAFPYGKRKPTLEEELASMTVTDPFSGSSSFIDWKMVAAACYQGVIQNYCFIGQVVGVISCLRYLGLDGDYSYVTNHPLRVVAFDHEDLSEFDPFWGTNYNNGKKKCAITFQTEYIQGNSYAQMMSSNTSEFYDYSYTTICKQCLNPDKTQGEWLKNIDGSSDCYDYARQASIHLGASNASSSTPPPNEFGLFRKFYILSVNDVFRVSSISDVTYQDGLHCASFCEDIEPFDYYSDNTNAKRKMDAPYYLSSPIVSVDGKDNSAYYSKFAMINEYGQLSEPSAWNEKISIVPVFNY